MSVRRLLVTVAAVAWLLPAATAGAMALHVAFEHPVGQPLEATAHVVAPAGHGPFFAPTELPHQHSAMAGAADLAMRRSLGSPTNDSTTSFIATGPLYPRRAADSARALLGPSRGSGPPRLARLSALRI